MMHAPAPYDHEIWSLPVPLADAGGGPPECVPAEGLTAQLPNAITMAGYAASLGWLAGGPSWLAVTGLLADEADGRVARAVCASSEFGSNFDWAVDITLTGLVCARLGILWALLPITAGQALLRSDGWRPPIGSARAALTIAALLLGK